jgi:hypothetical protein
MPSDAATSRRVAYAGERASVCHAIHAPVEPLVSLIHPSVSRSLGRAACIGLSTGEPCSEVSARDLASLAVQSRSLSCAP